MTPLRRAAATAVASVSLALVGALGIAPAADAHAKPTTIKHVKVFKRDVYCC